MSIEVHVFGKDELVTKFRKIRDELPSILRDAMEDEMTKLADYVRTTKLQGGTPLNRRTGTLSRSITGKAYVSGSSVIGTTGTSGVPYAPIHEFGAVFQREITQVFGRKLKVPKSVTFHYPERAFLRPSLRENETRIRAAIRDAAVGAMNAA